MTIELNEYIEKLRPVAEFRERVMRATHLWMSDNARRRAAAKERRDSETLLIREGQRCGILPAFLVPLLWKLLYAVAWQAIQYWLSKLHQPEARSMIQSILRWMERGSDSPAGTVTNTDAVKALRTAVILALAQGAVSALESFAANDFGPYKIIAGPVLAWVIDFVRRWATDNTPGV